MQYGVAGKLQSCCSDVKHYTGKCCMFNAAFILIFTVRFIVKLLLINLVHGKESLLFLCFTFVIKFLLISELDWALLGERLSLQYKNLVMVPKKEEKIRYFACFIELFFITLCPSTLETRTQRMEVPQ